MFINKVAIFAIFLKRRCDDFDEQGHESLRWAMWKTHATIKTFLDIVLPPDACKIYKLLNAHLFVPQRYLQFDDCRTDLCYLRNVKNMYLTQTSKMEMYV